MNLYDQGTRKRSTRGNKRGFRVGEGDGAHSLRVEGALGVERFKEEWQGDWGQKDR